MSESKHTATDSAGLLAYDSKRRTIRMCSDKEHIERVRQKGKVADGLGPFWRGMLLAALTAIDDLREANATTVDALKFVRIKAIPAGAAFVRGNQDREDRCLEVLSIIDAALAKAEGRS